MKAVGLAVDSQQEQFGVNVQSIRLIQRGSQNNRAGSQEMRGAAAESGAPVSMPQHQTLSPIVLPSLNVRLRAEPVLLGPEASSCTDTVEREMKE